MNMYTYKQIFDVINNMDPTIRVVIKAGEYEDHGNCNITGFGTSEENLDIKTIYDLKTLMREKLSRRQFESIAEFRCMVEVYPMTIRTASTTTSAILLPDLESEFGFFDNEPKTMLIFNA